MATESIRPTTIASIKQLARALKKQRGITHSAALDLAALQAGFQNFRHASHDLAKNSPPPRHLARISVRWRDDQTKKHGTETLELAVNRPLRDIVRTRDLNEAHNFSGFEFSAPDQILQTYWAESASEARRWICAAARTLLFMEATGLRPSKSRHRAYPGSDFSNHVPGMDHFSAWYDPAAKAHIMIDEPYATNEPGIPERRLAWARQFGWQIVKPRWSGMYSPDWGCQLYLMADASKGYDLGPITRRLNSLPPPIVETDWPS